MTTVLDFPALRETKGQLDAVRKELSDIFAEAGPDLDFSKVKSISGAADTASKAAHIASLNAKAADLGQQVNDLVAVQNAADYAREQEAKGKPVGSEFDGDAKGKPEGEAKSLGELFVASAAFKSRHVSTVVGASVEMKTLMSRSAGWTPESMRSGRVVLSAQRPVGVTDLLPTIPTSQAAYKYMEETTFTNNAAERAEGAAYGEAAFALTERSVTIESIGVWLPVTDEQLEDEQGAAAYVNARLPFMLDQRIDGQILVGDGSTPNILGVNNKPSIQTQAKGTDPTPDAIHKAITLVENTGRAMASAVVMHPNDWQDIRLLRTADGIYIWGNPSDNVAKSIWGLPVATSTAQTENTAVVGDFANYSLLVIRRGIEMKTTNAHDDYFIKGKQAIRADVRLATVWLRAAAFCTVTGV